MCLRVILNELHHIESSENFTKMLSASDLLSSIAGCTVKQRNLKFIRGMARHLKKHLPNMLIKYIF